MLNEPAQEAGQGGGGGVSEAGGGHMSYIQVTPQEKEAIERVSHTELFSLHSALFHSIGTEIRDLRFTTLNFFLVRPEYHKMIKQIDRFNILKFSVIYVNLQLLNGLKFMNSLKMYHRFLGK